MLKLLGSSLAVALALVACGQQELGSNIKVAEIPAANTVAKNKTAPIVYGDFKLAEVGPQDGCVQAALSIAPGFVAPMAIVETLITEECQKPAVDNDQRAYNIVAFNLPCGGRLYEGKSVQGDAIQIYDYRGATCDESMVVKVVETRAGSLPQTFVGDSNVE